MKEILNYTKYKTAEKRFMAVFIQKFYSENISGLAEELGISRQNVHGLGIGRKIPLKYASYLGRKYAFSPAILAFDKYVLLQGDIGTDFPSLVYAVSWVTPEESKYILGGEYITSSRKFLKLSDNNIKEKSNDM